MFIGNRKIDVDSPCFIIAEISANHNGKLPVALQTIKAAKRAGADAVKLQTYTPDTLTIDCDNEFFQIEGGTLWDGKTLYDLYKEAYTPWEWHEQLFECAAAEGLICFSSPFDKSAVDFLQSFDVPAYKIASFEIRDIPLIEYVASKGKPIIISTGIANKEDIILAIETCKKQNNEDIILLKCTSSYPAPLELANLRTIPHMQGQFDLIVGLSDHTLGWLAPSIAVSLGAKIIEKHFILDKSLGGPDASFSLDEVEFTKMVQSVRNTETLLGEVSYTISDMVKKNIKFARSLFIVDNVKRGELVTEKNVRSIRPGYGLHPMHLNELMGKRFAENYGKGTPLQKEMIK